MIEAELEGQKEKNHEEIILYLPMQVNENIQMFGSDYFMQIRFELEGFIRKCRWLSVLIKHYNRPSPMRYILRPSFSKGWHHCSVSASS